MNTNTQDEYLSFAESKHMRINGFSSDLCTGIVFPDNDLHLGSPEFVEIMLKKCLDAVKSPTFHQAFGWFRKRFQMAVYVEQHEVGALHNYVILWKQKSPEAFMEARGKGYRTHHEAEVECLHRLFDIINIEDSIHSKFIK